jgi:glycine/D-amino acid oxidase-like deaminating enzyme
MKTSVPADSPALRNYYDATAARPQRAALAGDIAARVCIVGAGFAGLATALGLLERGVDGVVVLDAQQVGFGASGRNGGFVFGGYSLDGADLLAQLGPEQARAAYALTRDALGLIRSRIARHAIDCDAVEGGALLVNWFDDETLLRRRQALMAEHFGVEWELIAKPQLDALVRSDRYFGALLEPDGFHFHPLKYALGEAAAIESLGARIFEHSPVIGIERHAEGMRVRTGRGTVRAEHVVVAGGGYLSGLVPELERAILPIATYVMVTEPLGKRLQEWLPSRAAIYDTRFAFDYYRALPDTRLLWGGRIAVLDRRPADIARFLKRDMVKVFPALQDAKVEFAWGGMMSYARHKMPQIGRLPDHGPWHGIGFGGHGVAPTTAAGELLAEAIAHGTPLPPAFARYGLARTFGPAGLAAAQASYGWSELRDWWRAR